MTRLVILVAALAAGGNLSGDDVVIDQAQAEMTAKKDWTEADRKLATELVQIRIQDWAKCIHERKVSLQKSREPVETIATAVMAGCTRAQTQARGAVSLGYRGLLDALERADKADEFVAKARAQYREAVIGYLVERRLPSP